MQLPRILLTAPSSASGKTTVTCGILQALINRGQSVSSFKCGPDYVDPMFHSKVIGTKARNLDPFMMTEPVMKHLLCKNSRHAEKGAGTCSGNNQSDLQRRIIRRGEHEYEQS